MGDSIWLYLWFLDKITTITKEGKGKVLGGRPVKYSDIKEEMGLSKRTYHRWLNVLIKNEYINKKRTPYGLIITVNKAKKKFKRVATNGISDEKLVTTIQEWNNSQPSPIPNFRPEHIINKHGVVKVGNLVKFYGKQNGGFSQFLKVLKS